jgi:hypothetical protein
MEVDAVFGARQVVDRDGDNEVVNSVSSGFGIGQIQFFPKSSSLAGLVTPLRKGIVLFVAPGISLFRE